MSAQQPLQTEAPKIDAPTPRSGLGRLIAFVRSSLSGELHDFTKGNLHRAILLLAIPMMLEMSMESLFAVVDVYFVAKLGAPAVAAVGLTESVLTLMYALAMGLSFATTAAVARRVGEGDHRAASVATWQAMILGLLLSCLIAVPGILWAEEILGLMGAKAETVEQGSGYTRLLLGSNLVIFWIFLINAAFRGAGDPLLAMKSLWLANGINIILDPCLIHGYGPFPAMGVTGAALATTIGRGTGVLYQCWCLYRGSGRLRLDREVMHLQFTAMLRLLHTSLGGIGQMLVATASWVALMRIVSLFGEEPVAGYTIAIRIAIFVFLPAWGLSNAAATLMGQNLGARQPARAERAVWLTGIYNMGFMALVTVLLLSLGPQLVSIFVDSVEQPQVFVMAVESLQILSYGYVAYAWGMVMLQAFNGAGDTMTPTWINLICFWAIQIPGAYALAVPAGLGPAGVFWSVMGAEALLAVVAVLWFRRGGWKGKEV